MGVRLISFTLLLAIFFSSSTFISEKKGIKTVVIDAGHGGKDPGCIGVGHALEKDVTLKIALKTGKLIKDSLKDVKVIYTRTTDKFIELYKRPEIANKNNADLFISIHCNANNSSKPNGSDTYIMGLHKTKGNLAVSKRENSVVTLEEGYTENKKYGGFDPNSPEAHIIFSMFQNAFLEQSAIFAMEVQKEMGLKTTIRKRGVKQAGFLVLWRTAMPSVLIETGFLTNKKDKEYLVNDQGQDSIAHSIFNALVKRKIILESQNRDHNNNN